MQLHIREVKRSRQCGGEENDQERAKEFLKLMLKNKISKGEREAAAGVGEAS